MIYNDAKSLLKGKLITKKVNKILQICWTVNESNKEVNLTSFSRKCYLPVILKGQVFLDTMP